MERSRERNGKAVLATGLNGVIALEFKSLQLLRELNERASKSNPMNTRSVNLVLNCHCYRVVPQSERVDLDRLYRRTQKNDQSDENDADDEATELASSFGLTHL